MTLDEFFAGQPNSREIFEAVLCVLQDLGALEPRITKSQIAFKHSRDFAWVWMPEKHLRRKAAPLVLSLAFRTRDPSPRWKQIFEPRPGRFMHHLELHAPADVDDQVRAWIRTAWEEAAPN